MNLITWLIIGAEVSFWIVILLGLFTRYILKKEKLGLFFLALTPVIDLILLLATAIDMYNGATATLAHAIAAVYLGISIAFGKSMIRWADDHFLYYVMKSGSKPEKKYGYEHARHSMKGSLQHVIAYVIGATFILLIVFIIDHPSRTEAFSNTLRIWTLVVVLDIVISASYFIWPRKAKA